MSIIAYMNGDELATKSMISGNGINLLDGTKNFTNFSANGANYQLDTGYSFAEASTSMLHLWGGSFKASIIKYSKSLKLVPSYYTLSFIASHNDDSNPIVPTLNVFNGSEVLASSKTQLKKQATFFIFTFKVNTISSINLAVGIDSDSGLPGGSIWFANLKLEAGVNPTPWSESVADQIQELKSSLSK